MLNRWFLALVAGSVMALPILAQAGRSPGIAAAARLSEARRAVDTHRTPDRLELRRSPGTAGALQAQWATMRTLLSVMLDREPALAPAALARQAKRTAGLRVDAVRLDPDSVLIGAAGGEFGTVFLLHRGADRRHRVALALDALPGALAKRMPELAAWAPSQADNDCQDRFAQPQWNRCGPLAVDRLIRLPDEVGGARRFAILAHRVAAAGGTVRYQVSIWRWDGRTATPLLARTLFQILGDAIFAGQDARGFTLHADENYKSLHACGECAGRQTIWRFDLPPAGAASPRIRGVSPELDLVDRLYTRIFAHQPAADLAAPSVITRLGDVELDMINSWRDLGESGGARRLCVDALGFDQPQIFRIVRRGGRLWIADVTFARPNACDG